MNKNNIGVFNSRSYTQEYMRDLKRIPEAGLSAPADLDLTPTQEIEWLEAMIADEQENLRAYASNARVVAVSQANIELYQTQVEQWQAAIIAAEHEAWLRVQKATQYGYPPELYTARRTAFVQQIRDMDALTEPDALEARAVEISAALQDPFIDRELASELIGELAEIQTQIGKE